MNHYVTSFTTKKTSMMNCRTTSLKKRSFKEIMFALFNGQDVKNSSDYRQNWHTLKSKKSFTKLSRTGGQHQHQHKCLYSLCFQHAILHKINLQGKLILLTRRKFFGSYSHYLIKPASEQYRLFSGRTSNTEKDEATLKLIKMFTSLSSNHYPNNVLINALIFHSNGLKNINANTNQLQFILLMKGIGREKPRKV